VSHWVEGHLRRVLWASEQTGYAIVRVETVEEEVVTAVGTLGVLIEAGEGAFVALEGRWETHAVHGRQFRATGYLQGTPRSLEGMRLYLASTGVKGVGPKLARRLVDRFGLHTPRVITQEPHRLREVEGIGDALCKRIGERWAQDEEGRALTMTLRGLGLSPRLVTLIRRRYGDSAAQVVATQPYRLAEDITGVGFKTADALARHQGIPLDAPQRVRAAVAHVVARDASDGHCYLPRRVLRKAIDALGVPVSGLDAAIDGAEGAGLVVVEAHEDGEQDRIWSSPLHQAEVLVSREILNRVSVQLPLTRPDVEITQAERYEGVALDPGQRSAVELALRGGVVIITGGPGTGKTTLLRVLLRVIRERGQAWKLASPTGRAARRLEEATGVSASTLHRLLEFRPGEGGFQRNFANPIDGDGLVVDEVSMVDIQLMSAVLEALPYRDLGFPLVLVGDADQLPSVGPGQVLRDLIESGAISVARLKTIHRQDRDSGIVTGAQAIQRGEIPTSGEAGGVSDLFLLPRADAEAARATLVKVVTERLPARGFTDIQVLAPTRRGPLGTEGLNALLQATLNADSPGITRGEREYRLNDRVICTRNRYDVEIFNGDIGRIRAIDGGVLSIDFDGRLVDWTRDDLGLLDLAYAITVHKSQGSEYDAVVLALHGSHGIMLRRNLFYTGLTRAKSFLCVIGDQRAWWRAVRQIGGDERHTALSERLREGPGDPVSRSLWPPESDR